MSDGFGSAGFGQHETAADYATLGLRPGADDAAIRAAYRRLAVEHHPDRGGSHDAMSRINEAFDRLTNPQPAPASVAAGPPIWEPPRTTAPPESRWTRTVLPVLRTTLSAAVIPILVILPAATVVGFIYVVGKILF